MSSTETTLPPDPVEPSAAPLVVKRNPLAILLGIVVKPRETFDYLRDQGGASWLWPLALALALALAARLIAAPIQRAQAEAMLAELQAQLETEGPPPDDAFTFAVPGGPVTGGLSLAPQTNALLDSALTLGQVLMDWALTALGLFALAWLFGGRPGGLGALFRMSAWALVPAIARQIVSIAVMLTTGSVPLPGLTGAFRPPLTSGAAEAVRLTVGPGAFADPSFTDLLWQRFLSAADIYALWGLALLVIGVAVTARLGWFRAGAATLLYAGLALVAGVLPALLSFYLLPLLGGGVFVR